jgi:hypothetical protein
VELADHGLADVRIVFDDEDRLVAGGDADFRLLLSRLGLGLGAREVELDGRPVAELAVDLDVPT